MNEEQLKQNISSKLTFYRKNARLTQLELAEKINYSDKSVSKWERGEGLPDIVVLSQLAEFFGVSVDDFMNSRKPHKPVRALKKHTIIPLLSVGLVWFVATVIYFVLMLVFPDMPNTWLTFIYALPAAFIVLVVFARLWWAIPLQVISVSGLIWVAALSIHLSFGLTYIYLIYVVAAVLQLLILLWFVLIYDKQRK